MEKTVDRFPARRSGRSARLFLVVMALAAGGGLWVALSGAFLQGIGIIAFFLVIDLAIVVQTLSPNTWYRVAPEGLILNKGFARRELRYTELRSAKVLSEQEASRILREISRSLNEQELDYDLRGWWRSGKAYGRFVRFCSITVVESRTTRGNWRNVTNVDVLVHGDFVFLGLADGTELLISPREPQRFVDAIHRRVPALLLRRNDEPITASSVLEDENGQVVRDVQDGRRRRKSMFIASVALFIVLVAATFLIQGIPDDTEKVPVESTVPSPEILPDAWVNGDVLRAEITCSNAEIYFMDDPEERRTELREELETCWPAAATGTIFALLLPEDHGISSDDYLKMHYEVEAIVMEATPFLLSSEFVDDERVIAATIDVRLDTLRDRVTEVTARYLTAGKEF